MTLLFPTKHKEISIAESKEVILARIRKHTEKVKIFRFIFSGHNLFEGEVLEDGFKLIYIGKLARNYKVEITGKIVEGNQNTILNTKTRVTTFGRILTYIWLTIAILFIVLTIYLTINHGQLIILTFTMFALLLLLLVTTVTYFGYRNESSKVMDLIEKIVNQE